MSMSTFVYGIKPPDDTWRKMKAVWDACSEAGVEPPEAVIDFFDDTQPDSLGVVVDLDKHDAVIEYSANMEHRFEVDITALPDDIKVIRFVNSY